MRWPAIVLLFSQSAAAQTVPTLRSDTRVVQIDVVAKDSRLGRIVEDLAREDFTVKDEGKPRAIQIFSINRGEPEAVIVPPVTQLPPNTFSNKVAIPGSASIHTPPSSCWIPSTTISTITPGRAIRWSA